MKQEGVNFICGPQGRVAESSQEASDGIGWHRNLRASFQCWEFFLPLFWPLSPFHCNMGIFMHFPSFPDIFSIKVVGSYYIYYTMTCNVDNDR